MNYGVMLKEKYYYVWFNIGNINIVIETYVKAKKISY